MAKEKRFVASPAKINAAFQAALKRHNKTEGHEQGQWSLQIWNTPTLYKLVEREAPHRFGQGYMDVIGASFAREFYNKLTAL